MIPPGFEAYARVFHPAGKGQGEHQVPVKWSEIAQANGKVAHAEMQFEFIVPKECFDRAKNCRAVQEGLWDSQPSDGELDPDIARDLATVLAAHAGTPGACFFAYWEGWGDPVPLMPPPRGLLDRIRQRRTASAYSSGEVFAGTPREHKGDTAHFHIPGRGFYLFEGTLDEVTTGWDGTGGELPSMWWSKDQSWCVATEIDFDSTYVGGSRACIDDLFSHDSLEALEASINNRIGRPSDTINRPSID